MRGRIWEILGDLFRQKTELLIDIFQHWVILSQSCHISQVEEGCRGHFASIFNA